jgi:hypothetical protein
LIGAGAVIFAPAAVVAVGDVLVGAGVATGSMALFGAGMSAYGASTTLANAITGVPDISTAPALNTPNEIGAWAEQQVGANLPVNIRHQRIFDPISGKTRIYDGNFIANPNAFVEVKTSTQGAVYATRAIRNQIAIDSNFGAKSGISPTWIFVNALPSRPLINLMRQNRIPWQQFHITLE